MNAHILPRPANDDGMAIHSRCRDLNQRIQELFRKPEPLTRSEWEELLSFERQGEEYDLLINAGLSHEEALEISGGVK